MCDNPAKRGFGFGCRETPDIYDKFLEQLGYYRKHTALDSSSLFRVVSEQQYDIQKYHDKVRKDCVVYMRSHKSKFVKEIKWGYETYLNNMTRPRTHGTLLELKALALLHKANVLLFEPFAEAKWFLNEASHEKVWKVFSGRDNHFDSVYSTDYMIQMAECQSIVYDILYTNVLGVPDVQYAVERMLHDPDDKKTDYGTDEVGNQVAITEDGRQLKLSMPSDTECVLIYSHLCHFHNYANFDAIQRFFAVHGSDEGYRVYIGPNVRQGAKKPNPLLADQNISCVRQLLNMGITPFPYKVAKALDRNIYRNVEFDVWHEMRMEKWNAFFSEIGNREKDGGKCNPESKQIKQSYGDYRSGERVRFSKNPFIEPGTVDDSSGTVPEQDLPAQQQQVNPFGITDSHLALAPFPMQQYYIPSPDQYGGINAVSVMDQSQLMYGDNSGQPPARVGGCAFHSVYPTAATPPFFHAPPGINQVQPQQQSLVPSTDQQLVPEQQQQQLPFVPNQISNEFLLLYDLYQSQLTQQLQQQQSQTQQQSQQPQQQQQQQQQIAPYAPVAGHAPYIHGCIYHCVPNAGDTGNPGTIAMAFDNNPFNSPPPVNGAQFWPNI